MKKAKLFSRGVATLGLTLALAACGGGDKGGSTADSGSTDGGKDTAALTAVIITDVGGVDDKSFNQSAWEGMQEWGKKHDIPEGVGGYTYIQSGDAADYATNIDSGVSQGFQNIFGIGYLLGDSIEAAAGQNPDTNFTIVDSVIEGADNVASATFKDNEAAYLAGYAAAYTTQTDKVGFVGGEEGIVIGRFQAGFEQGVADAAEELGKDISVDVKYAASFADAAKGKALAAAMYQSGIDVIFHASGATGAGVFQEAKDLNSMGESDKVWVIGVDSDQSSEGVYTTKDGKEDNCVLASTLKGVGAAVQDICDRALDGKFPGGEHLVYGLTDGGVDLTEGQLSDEAKAAVDGAKEKVIAGDVEVPEEPAK
ncbi:basic membrane protein A [Enterococcus sp. PF1-24]|uniref:BMP family lipoprotein n=1 Tax=unclassified Enterococcus TaxID=2608891 RepID=UPI002476F1F6|nr:MULTISPECIES: BMP family protein [unclassified Enterococcus]MDH6363875.1 basic membrane protein A [Enterococcus sp. PFB1-1]MDH6400939.1 basic membrane protein A [Enterococcus sp. PF1-24]